MISFFLSLRAGEAGIVHNGGGMRKSCTGECILFLKIMKMKTVFKGK